MSYTKRQFVSQVRSMSKLLSSDSLVNDRTIINEGRDAANKLVKQSLDQRKLWRSPNLFAFLPCLEMEQAALSECCEFTSDKTIARSKEKLPKIAEGNWGLAVQGVFGLDGKKKLIETNPSRYANYLKLGMRTKGTFWWVANERLYISNPDTEAVNFYAFFTEDIPNNLLYPGEDCDCGQNPPKTSDLCTSELDKPFYYPADKIDDIKKMVYTSLLQVYFNVPTDANKTSDQRDESSK